MNNNTNNNTNNSTIFHFKFCGRKRYSLSVDNIKYQILTTTIIIHCNWNWNWNCNCNCSNCSNCGGYIDAYYGQSSSISLAHSVNHPLLKQKPNVINYEFCWDYFSNDIKQNIERIGYKDIWYIDPITNKSIALNPATCHSKLIGICFITTKSIEQDQEILFDYKYEPKVANKLKWYSKVI